MPLICNFRYVSDCIPRRLSTGINNIWMSMNVKLLIFAVDNVGGSCTTIIGPVTFTKVHSQGMVVADNGSEFSILESIQCHSVAVSHHIPRVKNNGVRLLQSLYSTGGFEFLSISKNRHFGKHTLRIYIIYTTYYLYFNFNNIRNGDTNINNNKKNYTKHKI